MIIKINNDKAINVIEPNLCIKDKYLYNTETKQREGVDGDIISFMRKEGSSSIATRGSVDGYTCGNRVKLRGLEKVFENVSDIKIEHLSTITEFDSVNIEEELLLAEE